MIVITKEKREREFRVFNHLFVFSRSKEQKCTKPQACSAGICTWNQRLEFFDIDTIDNLSLWIKLVDFDRNQYALGEVKQTNLSMI